MMDDPTLADLLFILAVCGVIWAIMAIINRVRRSRPPRTEKSAAAPPDRGDSSP